MIKSLLEKIENKVYWGGVRYTNEKARSL